MTNFRTVLDVFTSKIASLHADSRDNCEHPATPRFYGNVVPVRHLRRNLAWRGDRPFANQCLAARCDASLGMASAVHRRTRERNKWPLQPAGPRARREAHWAAGCWGNRRATGIVPKRAEDPAIGDNQSDRTQSDLGGRFLYAFRLYDRVFHKDCSDSKI